MTRAADRALSLDPTPGAARRVWLQATYDTRLTMANGEQLLLTVIIPVALLIGLVLVPAIDLAVDGVAPDTPRVALALPGVVAVAVLSSAFASLAIATGFDRRSGALLLLATSPLSRVELVWARALSTLLIVAAQTVLLTVIAVALGWRPDAGSVAAIGFIVLGALALAACAIMIAGVLRAEATLAVANGIFLLLLVAGGTALPLSSLPAPVAAIAALLPSGALGEGLRWSLLSTPTTVWWTGPLANLAVLVAWMAIGAAIARRSFRWD